MTFPRNRHEDFYLIHRDRHPDNVRDTTLQHELSLLQSENDMLRNRPFNIFISMRISRNMARIIEIERLLHQNQ
jgi:hypothetical protein